MSQRVPLYVANWKMNKWVNEVDQFLIPFMEQLSSLPQTPGEEYEVVILPQASHLAVLGMGLSQSPIQWGGQNVGPEQFGAYTGEVSAAVIKELGGTWALSGHSERRHVFGEDLEMVLKRSLAALGEGLRLILCVGETLEERKAGNTSLFDQTTTLLTASMGSANAHNFDDLPALVFDARIRTPDYSRHKDVPMSNLYLGLLQQFGAEQDRFGESNGTFDLLA